MEVVAKFTLSEAMNHRNLEIFKPLFGKILKSEQQENTIREFLLPHFDAVVAERVPFALPSGEDIIEAIVEDCEESD